MIVLGSFYRLGEICYLEVSHLFALVGWVVVDLADLSDFSVVFSVFVGPYEAVQGQYCRKLLASLVVCLKYSGFCLVVSCAQTER